MELPSIAIVAPVFNEEAGIEETVLDWNRQLTATGANFELVLCDDCSTDGTAVALSRLAYLPTLRVVTHDVNQGAGAALRSAIKASTAEWLITIDSDGQFLLSEALRMWTHVADRRDIAAIGVRRKDDRFSLVVGSKLSGWLANRVYGTRLGDFNCALKVIYGDHARSVTLRATRFNYSTDMTSRLILQGVQLLEFPVSHRQRAYGKSSARLVRDGLARLRFIGYLRAESVLIREGSLDPM